MQLNKQIQQIIEQNYKIPKIKKVEKLDIKGMNKVFKVSTARKAYFFKLLTKKSTLNENNVRTQLDIAEHLNKKGKNKGMKTILALPNKNKDKLTVVNGEFYIMYPFEKIDKIKKLTKKHFDIAVKKLAQFHNLMEDFQDKHGYETRPMQIGINDITNFSEYDSFRKRDSVMKKAFKTKTKFAKKVINDAQLIQAAIIKALNALHSADFTRETILHYDYNKDNLFFKEGKLLAISDFEFSHKGFVESDLAKAGKYWSENTEDASINIELFKKFITDYSKLNKCSLNWQFYHALLVYVALRRLVSISQKVLNNKTELEYLYDYDIKMIRFLMKNKHKF